jgi:hypothetical protein
MNEAAKPSKGLGLLVLCVSVSPLVFVLYFLLSLAVSDFFFCIAVVLAAGYLTWQATTSYIMAAETAFHQAQRGGYLPVHVLPLFTVSVCFFGRILLPLHIKL